MRHLVTRFRVVLSAGLPQSAPLWRCGRASGNFHCRLEPASSLQLKPALSRCSSTFLSAASSSSCCCSRSTPYLKTAIIKVSFTHSSCSARWACVCSQERLSYWLSLSLLRYLPSPLTSWQATAKKPAAALKPQLNIFCSVPSPPVFFSMASRSSLGPLAPRKFTKSHDSRLPQKITYLC